MANLKCHSFHECHYFNKAFFFIMISVQVNQPDIFDQKHFFFSENKKNAPYRRDLFKSFHIQIELIEQMS